MLANNDDDDFNTNHSHIIVIYQLPIVDTLRHSFNSLPNDIVFAKNAIHIWLLISYKRCFAESSVKIMSCVLK